MQISIEFAQVSSLRQNGSPLKMSFRAEGAIFLAADKTTVKQACLVGVLDNTVISNVPNDC